MGSDGQDPIWFAAVIIAYNQEAYIADAIQSVLDQTAQDVLREIVVVDDASQDATASVARDISARDGRVRVIVLSENSGGCSTPRNTGILATRAPYIAFLDGDDIWAPDKLETEHRVLQQTPEIGLLFSDYQAFDPQTGAERHVKTRHYAATDHRGRQLRRFFIHGGPVIPSGAVVRRSTLDCVGPFDPAMLYNEDSELWNRIAGTAPLHHIRKSLVRKREWFGSLGSAKYGAENLAAKHEITIRMVKRYPELQTAVPRRRSQIATKAALHECTMANLSAARRHFRKAIAADPGNVKALAYFLATFLPCGMDLPLRVLRQLRQRALSLGR